jgi:hypothetical protein
MELIALSGIEFGQIGFASRHVEANLTALIETDNWLSRIFSLLKVLHSQ